MWLAHIVPCFVLLGEFVRIIFVRVSVILINLIQYIIMIFNLWLFMFKNIFGYLVLVVALITLQANADPLPPEKKPGVLGCKAGIAADPSKLAEALWCLSNTTQASDPNFWSKAKKHLTLILPNYDNGGDYLAKLSAPSDYGTSTDGDNRPMLPKSKEPVFGCVAALVANEKVLQKGMAQVLFCVEKNTQAIVNGATLFPDPNFMAMAINNVPPVLGLYKDGADYLANLKQYGWPDAGGLKVLPQPQQPDTLGCRVSLLGSANIEYDLPRVLWCLNNTTAQTDINFWSRARQILPNFLKAYAASDDYLAKLGAQSGDDRPLLPMVKKPVLGCRTALVASEEKTKANLAEVMSCFALNAELLKNGQAASDPNFMKLATQFLPNVLKGYQGGDDWLNATGYNPQ